MLAAFNDATQQPHSYLAIDCTQSGRDAYRLRTGPLQK
jgi:hypothetical protein